MRTSRVGWQSCRSADARQLLTAQPVHHTATAEAGFHLHESVGVLDHLADDRCLPALRMRAHRGKQCVGVFGGADRDQLAFIGDVERIEAEQFACRFDCRLHRNRGFIQMDADAGLMGDFVDTRIAAPEASIAAVRPLSEALSDRIGASNDRFSRLLMIAMP